ncbi:6054_t:CDS:1, partial [Gigaspora margarita]
FEEPEPDLKIDIANDALTITATAITDFEQNDKQSLFKIEFYHSNKI